MELFGAEEGVAPSAVYTGMAPCCATTTFPLPSTQSGAAVPVNIGVAAPILLILIHARFFTQESIVSLADGALLQIPIFQPVL